MIYSKTIIISVLMLLTLTGCQSENSNTSSDKNQTEDGFEEFFRPETKKFEGGVYLPDRQEVRYSIVTNNNTFNVEMSIRNPEGCFKASGWLYVAEINGMEKKKYEKLSSMKVQSKYHSSWEGPNAQFVHFIMDKDIGATSCLPYVVFPEVDKEDYKSILYKYLFSEFNFNENQLKIASAELLHGSSQSMFYIKKYDIGVIIDVSSKKLIGISIPKHKLITKYLFTSHRNMLRTDKIEDLSLNPLILTDEDEKVNEKTEKYLRHLRQANERMKNDSEEARRYIINSVWSGFFKN